MYRDNLTTVVENLARKVDDLERDINVLKSIDEEYSKLKKEQKVKKENKILTRYQKVVIISIISILFLCGLFVFAKHNTPYDGLFFIISTTLFVICAFSTYLVFLGLLCGTKVVEDFFDNK